MPQFQPKEWQDGSTGGTPITAAALKDLELRVSAYADLHTAWVPADALHRRVKKELSEFTNWLDGFGVRGFIGEFGVPTNTRAPTNRAGDALLWTDLLDGYYRELNRAQVWSAQWGSSQALGIYELAPYVGNGVGSSLDTTMPASIPLERHLNAAGVRRGVAVTGLEFNAEFSGYSNINTGTLGQNYFDEPAGSFTYLASRGVRLARVGFKWERVQPTLGGALNSTYLGLIQTQVGRAKNAGMQVVLDCHNYGYYATAPGVGQGGSHPIGATSDPTVTVAHFVDLWQRLSTTFKSETGVLAYGIMNEPNNLLPGPGGATPQAVWEDATQQCVDGIRSNGDNKLIMVPGYFYSKVQGWSALHPQPWIFDPNIAYEAHHYWDSESSNGGLATSVYDQTYASALSDAVAAGF